MIIRAIFAISWVVNLFLTGISVAKHETNGPLFVIQCIGCVGAVFLIESYIKYGDK